MPIASVFKFLWIYFLHYLQGLFFFLYSDLLLSYPAQFSSFTYKYIMKVLVTQSCLTLCDPMGCSQPGPSVHGSLQARILEWVSIPFSRGSSQPRDQIWVSHITGRFFTMSHQGSPVCCLWANKYLEKLENYLCWEVHISFWTVFTSNKRRKILGTVFTSNKRRKILG